MFYLMTHSSHFLTIIWRQTYGKGPLTQQERKPAATITWATLSDKQQGLFYMDYPTDMIVHTTTFVTPVVKHWLE